MDLGPTHGLDEAIKQIAIFGAFWTINLICIALFFVSVFLAVYGLRRLRGHKITEVSDTQSAWGGRLGRQLLKPIPLASSCLLLLLLAFIFIDSLRAWWFTGLIQKLGATNEATWENVACFHLNNVGGAQRLGKIALDTDSPFRKAALNAMYYDRQPVSTEARDKAILPVAARLLHDPDLTIRIKAATVLLYVNPVCSRQISILADVGGSMDAECQAYIMKGIVYHSAHCPEDRPILAKVLNDPSPAVWQGAMKAMVDLHHNGYGTDAATNERVAALFRECLPRPNHEQKLMLIKLFQWGDSVLAPIVLAPLLDDKSKGMGLEDMSHRLEGFSAAQIAAYPGRICDNAYIIIIGHFADDKRAPRRVGTREEMDGWIDDLKQRLAKGPIKYR